MVTTPGEWWPLSLEPGKWTQAVTCHGAGTFSRGVRIFTGRHSIEAFHVSGLPWTNLLPVQALLGLVVGVLSAEFFFCGQLPHRAFVGLRAGAALLRPIHSQVQQLSVVHCPYFRRIDFGCPLPLALASGTVGFVALEVHTRQCMSTYTGCSGGVEFVSRETSHAGP